MGHPELIALGLTIGARAQLTVAGQTDDAVVVQTFADVPEGDLLLYEDAWGSLAIAVNRGDAAGDLGLGVDDEVRIAPAA